LEKVNVELTAEEAGLILVGLQLMAIQGNMLYWEIFDSINKGPNLYERIFDKKAWNERLKVMEGDLSTARNHSEKIRETAMKIVGLCNGSFGENEPKCGSCPGCIEAAPAAEKATKE
jgi:hypothetical protein